MAKFEKARFFSNLYFLAKTQGLKIGDIEESAGVSLGYISRLSKEDNKTVPGIEFLLSISEILGVALEGLLKCDYSTITADEQKVIDFLNQLISDTRKNDKLKWYRRVYDIFNGEVVTNLSDSVAAAIRRDCAGEEPGILCDIENFVTNVYSAQIKEYTDLYLIEIEFDPRDGASYAGYLMYMSIYGTQHKICYTDSTSDHPFSALLQALTSAAESSANHIHLEDAVRNAIDEYMDFNNVNVPF